MAQVIAGVGFAAFGTLLALKGYHYVDNADKLAREDYEDMPRRAVMSMLVHCAYFRDMNMMESLGAWISDYNNPRAEDYGKHWREHHPKSAEESELKKLGLAFFRRRKRTHRNPDAPDLAIVLRGTLLTKGADWSADFKLVFQLLNKSKRVKRTKELILQVVVDSQLPHDRICMAGHSLGAAIALIVGGWLYTEHEIEIDIDTHLFNPPLVALDDSPRRVPEPTFRAHVKPGQRDQVSVLEAEANASRWKEALVRDKAAMLNEWLMFKKLESWFPHFYLNPGDPVCQQYISYFMDDQGGRLLENPADVISPQGLATGIVRDKVTYFKNVVPSAHVYISTWKEGDWLLAHSLQQWHKFEPKHINLETHENLQLLNRAGRIPPASTRREPYSIDSRTRSNDGRGEWNERHYDRQHEPYSDDESSGMRSEDGRRGRNGRQYDQQHELYSDDESSGMRSNHGRRGRNGRQYDQQHELYSDDESSGMRSKNGRRGRNRRQYDQQHEPNGNNSRRRSDDGWGGRNSQGYY